MKRRETGNLGEKLAQDFLKKRGYHILETNYRCPRGEIDIIARDKGCLVFIEVRTKTNLSFGSPEESVTTTKKTRLIATARYYRQCHRNLPSSWRIDFVAVTMSQKGATPQIELIKSAVDGD